MSIELFLDFVFNDIMNNILITSFNSISYDSDLIKPEITLEFENINDALCLKSNISVSFRVTEGFIIKPMIDFYDITGSLLWMFTLRFKFFSNIEW